MIRTYAELSKLKTFKERYEYLRLGGVVGTDTFGFDRYLNQIFYRSTEYSEYKAQLSQRGLENLSENIATKSFEGKVETTRMYRYGEDFFLGDMVQIVNEYGIEGKARVTEFIRSQSKEGLDSYPTFVTVE